ncbi:hypothetical protein F5Y03DRAFT_332231 [Xylaria venustula]|nr:hypothetical protein F5Y03DRAFT_332231 [Xylaria venustula]
MSLLRLPPEILVQIFDQIDPSFFHEDIRRLTICKQWLEFVLPVCLKCVKLSQETLRSLMVSRAIERSSTLIRSVETLDLELRGYPSYISSFYLQENTEKLDDFAAPVSNETPNDISVETWVKSMGNNLSRLAVIAQQSRRLHTLRIRARNSPSPEILENPVDYLSLPTMQSFLQLDNLSNLVLDLNTNFLDSRVDQRNGLHICPAIGALLGTLRTLHLRMRSICPDVLTARDSNDNLNLRVVVINLSLITNQPGITAAVHSERCGSGVGQLQLRADIKEQAEALVTRMASPKTIRILTHSLPSFQIRSFDILTGNTMTLNDGAAWDEDGRTVVEDSEPDSDFSGDSILDFEGD